MRAFYTVLLLITSNVFMTIAWYGHSGKPYAYEYLTQNIDYLFDEQKRQALSLYWDKGMKFSPPLNPG